jgi:tetratricopeptide (TPR) repeat protein
MNKFFGVALTASALTFQVKAQSVTVGEKWVNYGKLESATKTLTPLAASDALANYYLGIAQLESDNLAAAKATFGKFADEYHNQAGMARVLFAEGKKDDATRMLLAITDKAKKKEWEKYKTAADAITYSTGGNITDAITWYNKAIEVNGGDANTLIALGDAYLKTSDGGGNAMSSFEKAVEKGGNNSLAYSKIGDLWYRARNYKLALENYQKAKESDPSNPLPYKSLANAYHRAGNFDLALTNIKSFLDLSDKSVDDELQYADLLFLTKNYSEAQSKIQELLDKKVEKPYLYRLVAYSAFETNDVTKAFENMKKFYAKQPASKIITEDYVYSGKIFSALAAIDTVNAKSHSDSAEYYFNKVITADTSKDKRDLYLQVAGASRDAKNYAKTAFWYNKIVQESPTANAEDYFYAGYWAFVSKDYTAASNTFKAMAAKYPEEGSALLWQAKVAATVDSDGKTGGAVQPYKDWLAFAKEGYSPKPADQMAAYQYLAYYYYNSKNQTDAMVWVNKILEQDPNDKFANDIKTYYSKAKSGK